ncbi:MAG: TlpA disulfide reductase family protein [Bacteroidota bacterium]
MKKLSKNRILNGIWLLAVLLILFTPIGFHVKVFINTVFAGRVDSLASENRKKLHDYHWQLTDIEENAFFFEQNKGKVVLISFWATWCPPCIAEMPDLVSLYNDYHEKMVFMFVASDQRNHVINFLEKKAYEIPVYFQNSEAPQLLNSERLPATYIIGKNGEIVVAEIGAAKWNSKKVTTLLDELLY